MSQVIFSLMLCFRDINPKNIMINEIDNEPFVTLIDFNVSRKFRDVKT